MQESAHVPTFPAESRLAPSTNSCAFGQKVHQSRPLPASAPMGNAGGNGIAAIRRQAANDRIAARNGPIHHAVWNIAQRSPGARYLAGRPRLAGIHQQLERIDENAVLEAMQHARGERAGMMLSPEHMAPLEPGYIMPVA